MGRLVAFAGRIGGKPRPVLVVYIADHGLAIRRHGLFGKQRSNESLRTGALAYASLGRGSRGPRRFCGRGCLFKITRTIFIDRGRLWRNGWPESFSGGIAMSN
jgi:hypothetical protein